MSTVTLSISSTYEVKHLNSTVTAGQKAFFCNHVCDFFVFLPLQLYAALVSPRSWPFLCCFVITLFQLSAAFSRILTKDLLESFLEGLGALVPRLLELYKAAVASSRRLTLSGVTQCLQKEVLYREKTTTY